MDKKKIFNVSTVFFISLILTLNIVGGNGDDDFGTETQGIEPEAFTGNFEDGINGGQDVDAQTPTGPATINPTSQTRPVDSATIPGGATASYTDGVLYSTQFTSVETRSGITGNNINNAIIRSDGSINAIFAQILKFLGFDGNEVEMEDADKIDIKSNGDYSIESVRQLNSPALTIINGQNIVSEGSHIYVGHSQRLDYLDVASQNVDDFESFARDEFTVSNADVVIVGGITFTNVNNASFVIFNSYLVSAEMESDRNNNTITMDNPLQLSSDKIEIEYDKEESFSINYAKVTQDNRRTVEITADEGVMIKLGDITFTPFEDGGSIIVIEGNPPEYKVRNGQLNFTTGDFIEMIESKCEFTSAEINYNTGFKKVILSPLTTVLCPGGRYSYIDRTEKQKSFSILNTGIEYYELGFNKLGLLPYNMFSASVMDSSWGYINLPSFIELNGIIQYDRYRELFQGESPEEYKNSNLMFMPVYKSFQNNKAQLNLNGKFAEIAVGNLNLDETDKIISETNTGFHRIIEKQINGVVYRFEDFNRDILFPPYATKYESFFGINKPRLDFTSRILNEICEDAQTFMIFSPGTKASDDFENELIYLAGITFDAYFKKFGTNQKILEGQ